MKLYTSDMAGSGQFGTCAKCMKGPTKEGHDGCIGTLPALNVMNACCGHGRESSAYVQFIDEPRISGAAALRYIEASKPTNTKGVYNA